MSSRLYDCDPALPIASREPTPARHPYRPSSRYAGARRDDDPPATPAGHGASASARHTLPEEWGIADGRDDLLGLFWACVAILAGLAACWVASEFIYAAVMKLMELIG